MINETKELPYEDKIENFSKNIGNIIARSFEKFLLENPKWSGAVSCPMIADWLNGPDEKIRVNIEFARVKRNKKGDWEVVE